MQRILKLSAFFCLLLASLAIQAVETPSFPKINVNVGARTLQVDYAPTFELRSHGLMFRRQMCDDCGMLFRFEQPKRASMWMKNTYLPLDVAFIDEQGVICDIKAMEPHDLTPVGSSKHVLYALEMHQGWFATNGIKVGDSIGIQPVQ